MVLPLIAALGLGAIGVYLSITVIGTLVHWTAVAAGFGTGLYTVYWLAENQPVELGFGSELLENLVYGFIGVATGLIVFKIVQAGFVVFGGVIALLLAVALVYPPLIINGVKLAVTVIGEVVGEF